MAAQGRLPRLAALAQNPDEAGIQIQIPQVDGDQFRKAQAAAVEQFRHRQIALFQGRLGLEIEQPGRHVRIQGAGQLAARLGRPGIGDRVRLNQALPFQIAEETAGAGKEALQAARTQALGMQAGDQGRDLMRLDLLPRRVERLGDALQIPPIGIQRVLRVLLLELQVIQEGFNHAVAGRSTQSVPRFGSGHRRCGRRTGCSGCG